MTKNILRSLTLLALLLVSSLAQSATAQAATCAPRSSSYSATVSATPGLVGYWRLGESFGPDACDSGAGAHHGTYQTGVTLAQTGAIPGDPDTSVAFNGTGAWASVPDSPALAFSDRFSTEAWVRRGAVSTSAYQVVTSKQSGSWVLMFDSANHLVLRRSGVANLVLSTRTVTDTTSWHHVAATKDGPLVHLYIDGADVTGTVANQVMANNTLPLSIGQSSNSAYFNGLIDEVAVYNAPLTATQVANHYKASTTTTTPPPSGADPVIGTAGDIACSSSTAISTAEPVRRRPAARSTPPTSSSGAVSLRCCRWETPSTTPGH